MNEISEVKIIVVTGVESTGKSTLVQDLAEYYSAPCVLETAREYLEDRNGAYEYEDIEAIARQQLNNILVGKKKATKYLFVDTAFFVLKIWSEEKYDTCSKWILDQLADFKPAAYILCDIDIPWEKDSLREHPTTKDREQLHSNYVAHLQEQSAPFMIVSKTKKERLEKAAQFIGKFD